jgi:hypothetical protein
MLELGRILEKGTQWNKERDELYKSLSFNAENLQAAGEKSMLLKKKKAIGGMRGRRDKEDGNSFLFKASDLIQKEIPVGFTLSSSKIPQFKPAMQAKINACLEEFGVPLRPKIPTQMVLETFEQVVSAAHALIEARKYQERLMNDLKIARANKKTLESDIASGKPLTVFVSNVLLIIRKGSRGRWDRMLLDLLET